MLTKQNPAIKKLVSENKKLQSRLTQHASEISNLKEILANHQEIMVKIKQQSELIAALTPVKKSRKK